MKGRNITTAGILACAIAALTFIFYKVVDYSVIVVSVGAILVVAGLLDLVFYSYRGRQGLSTVLGFVTNMGCLLLGVSMLVFTREYGVMISFMLGLMAATLALWQFFVLAVGSRPYQLPSWLYLIPVLLVAASVYIFICRLHGAESSIIAAAGGSLALTGVGCLVEGSLLGVARRNYEKARHAAESPTPAATAADATAIEGDADLDEPYDDEPHDNHDREHDDRRHDVPAAPGKVETTDDLDDEIIE